MKHLDVPKSGSLDSQTYSRNRYGQYVRSRAIPVNPNSAAQGAVRSRFGDNSQAWRALTDAQRNGWWSLGGQIQRTDSLGQVYTLTGQQAYVFINNNRLAAGDAVLSDAPALISPTGLVTLAITTTGGTLSAAYTVTPLGAGQRLFVYASPQRSTGRNFEGDYRLIFQSAAAAASPANILAAYTGRFGAPVVGNKIFFSGVVYNGGFLSAPLNVTKVVTA